MSTTPGLWQLLTDEYKESKGAGEPPERIDEDLREAQRLESCMYTDLLIARLEFQDYVTIHEGGRSFAIKGDCLTVEVQGPLSTGCCCIRVTLREGHKEREWKHPLSRMTRLEFREEWNKLNQQRPPLTL